MKRFILLISIIGFMSCKDKNKTDNQTPNAQAELPKTDEFHKELYGIYSGDFIPEFTEVDESFDTETNKKISLRINKITKDSVFGQSIVSGNSRPFSGTYTIDGNEAKFILDEPGDDKYDGRFDIKFKNNDMTGVWDIFTPIKGVSPKKHLKLKKVDFVYNPENMLDSDLIDQVDFTNSKKEESSYIGNEGEEKIYVEELFRKASDAIFKLNASTEKLTAKQLKDLSKLDLDILRNTIFARHGYSFQKDVYRNFFEPNPWYIPITKNVENELTPLEKENIALIAKYEKTATDNYNISDSK